MDVERLKTQADLVANILKQMANKHRLLILCVLAEQELSVTELNQQVSLSQSALSQHLAKLREAGLVVTRRASQTIFYQVADDKIKALLGALHDNYCQSGQ
jgi:ArsR family transcriptional regulator, virulence genes transcriptional regulator